MAADFLRKKSRETYKIRASLMVSIFDNEIIEKSRDEVICFLIPPALLKICLCLVRNGAGWRSFCLQFVVVYVRRFELVVWGPVWVMQASAWFETGFASVRTCRFVLGSKQVLQVWELAGLCFCQFCVFSLWTLCELPLWTISFSLSLSRTNNNTVSFLCFFSFVPPLWTELKRLPTACFYSERMRFWEGRFGEVWT